MLANLAAMPVVSAVVMPAGLIGLLAMPFGIDWMIAVTRWVSGLPGAVGRVAAFGTPALIVASIGLVLLGLLRTPLRWSGAGLLALAIVWAAATPRPDILISGDGRNVAVRGRDGQLYLMRTSKDAFLFKEWLAADADARSVTDPSLADGVSCDDAGCVAPKADGALVALSLRADALADDCVRAGLVVSARQPPESCAASVIDRKRVQRQGALVLRERRGGFVVDAVRRAAWTGRGRPHQAVARIPTRHSSPNRRHATRTRRRPKRTFRRTIRQADEEIHATHLAAHLCGLTQPSGSARSTADDPPMIPQDRMCRA